MSTPYGQTAEHPKAQMVFILGIIGIFVQVPIAFIAWYMGGQAKKEIEANPNGPYKFEGNLKTGYILGKIFSILGIIGIVITIIYVVVVVGILASATR